MTIILLPTDAEFVGNLGALSRAVLEKHRAKPRFYRVHFKDYSKPSVANNAPFLEVKMCYLRSGDAPSELQLWYGDFKSLAFCPLNVVEKVEVHFS